MSALIQKTLHYGRVERITIRLTAEGLKQLLMEAKEIPEGFRVESCDLEEPCEIILSRETPVQP